MTRHGFAVMAMLGVASLIAPAPAVTQDAAGVTGAAQASFPNSASFNGVTLSGLTLGQGVVIALDGSATGQFQAVLLGTSAIGAPQNVIVEGEVTAGSVVVAGTATFSGTATVDMGDGSLPVVGVPFTVTTSSGSLGLLLGAIALPVATVTAGSITVQ